MADTSSSSANTTTPPTRTAPSVSVTVDHPRLARPDPESIRRFLNSYDQYVHEVIARGKQLGVSVVGPEASRPVDLKYCVDIEYLKSTIALGLIPSVSSYEELTGNTLREYLDNEAAESRNTVTLTSLESIIKRELRMDMKNPDGSARMRNLFIDYHTLLRRYGLSWVLDSSEKVAVQHVLSAIRPAKLRSRLESDLAFSHAHTRKDFKAFFKHAQKIADAFALVDNGSSQDGNVDTPNTNSGGSSSRRTRSNGNNGRNGGTPPSDKPSKKTNKDLPICLWPPHRERGIRHRLKDCRDCPDAEKKGLFEELSREKASDGPAANTRSKSTDKDETKKEYASGNPKTGRLVTKTDRSPKCTMTLCDGTTTMDAVGRCDDGSDDSLASPRVAEAAALKGIGKLTSIDPVTIEVALRQGKNTQSFTFSRSWLAPRLVLHLSSGRMALCNISFLVADDDLACEDLLIGLPVLQHLRIDSKTLLENNRATLDGTDCAEVGNPTATHIGRVGHFMVARTMRVKGNSYKHGIEYGQRSAQPSRDRPRVHYDEARSAPDPFPDPSLLDPLDDAQHDDIRAAVEKMLQAAQDNGLPPYYWERLQTLVYDHIDVFRVSFSSGPPARLPPLRIELTTEASPVRCRLRNYSSEQKNFMEDVVGKLIKAGMVYPNPTARWASPPLIVPKPGAARFRFTVDLRAVNCFTIRHHFPMPLLDNELTKLKGSKFFADFDLSHGYWQLLLHADSQECQSFLTPDGVFTPTRVLHGTTNAVAHLQSTLSAEIPIDLRKNLLQWLDDILLHCPTILSLLDAIETFLKLCVRLNLRLHPAKCLLFANSVRWCGRLIDEHGWRFDPKNMESLRDMSPPTTGAHLQQFVCALNWIRTSIPKYAALTAPLHDFLETVYAAAHKRTRRGVARIQLAKLGWGDQEQQAFEDCKSAVAHNVTLSHRDPAQRLCIYTDASDVCWSGIATQVPDDDLNLPHAERRHTPLAFLSGRFTDTQLRWNVLEKEGFAVVASLTRLHWLTATPSGFDLFTDHNNLVFIFDPLSLIPDLSQSCVRKVLRWAVRLSIYNYVCYHISGEDNVWADLLGRWSAVPIVRRLLFIPPLLSSADADFVWPQPEELQRLQSAATNTRPNSAVLDDADGLWKHPSGAIWVPDDAADLQLRLCVIAHTSAAGHRGQDATSTALKQKFSWRTLSADVKSFTRSCLHCLSTTGGTMVPRPFGPAVHGVKPNDLLQFDYLELGAGSTGQKYVLLLRDDHSGYCWLFPFGNTNAENAAHAIVDWCASFGVPAGLISDGPTHFRNETVRLVTKALRTPHHFTLPYCPWSNGAVERLGREVLRTARALLSELQLRPDQWPDLIPVFQSVLNQSPSPQRNNVAPITAFTGLPPTPPIATFMSSDTARPVTIAEVIQRRALDVHALQERMQALRPVVESSLQANRARARTAAERGELANFTEGDYVLVARDEFHAGEKLCLRWRGPRRVTKAINDYVYQVEDLRNGILSDVHAARLKFYSDASLDAKVLLPHVLQSETGMQVQRLLRLVDTDHGLRVVIRWRGLTASEDTEEPLQQVFEDVPDLLGKLLARKSTPEALVAKARRALGLLDGGV